MKTIKLIPVLLLFCLTTFGQTNSNDSTKINDGSKVTNPNETIMKYEEFLRDETKLHREYTQEYYDKILKLLWVLGIVIGSVLAWFNWKSKADIKKQVNVRFKETIQGLLDEKLKQIDNLFNEGKEKSEKQFDDIDKKLKEIDNLYSESKEKSEKQFEDSSKIILELISKSKKIGVQGLIEIEEEEKSDLNNLKGKTILWVDDFPRNNDYPKSMLEQAGIKFTLALDTEKAVDILQKRKFDLIISDMGRGKNSSAGLDLLRELRLLKINSPVIIYASSRAIETFGREALKLGAVYVTTGVASVLNIVQKILLTK